ncbi:MAG: sigma-70 family RNA polymerase sigma factor, partial [Oscillospiraceae bacterium]
CAIAKNLWFNKCKRENREILPDNSEITVSDDSLEQHLINKDLTLYIHKMLHTMDEPYKEVFTLRTFGELPFADIASLFSKTESWARVTYYRSKKIMIEKLRKGGYYE